MILVMVMMAAASVAVYAQKRMFDKLPKMENLDVVYISRPMMKMGLSLAGNGDNTLSGVINSISNAGGMEVVSADSSESREVAKKEAEKRIKERKMQLMLNTLDEGDTVSIYTGEAIDDKTVRDIMIVTEEPDEYTIVYIMGDIDVEALTSQFSNKH